MTFASRVDSAVRRIDAGTPAHRDRTVDALRAIAIIGVILGHWTVTALIVTDSAAGGTAERGALALRIGSPLKHMPELVPISWLLQTLALFFFVGGYAGARSLAAAERAGQSRPAWVRTRLIRLARPAAVLLVAWTPLIALLAAADVDTAPVLKLLLSPLWFLCVYAVVTALTPLLPRSPRSALVAAAGAVVLVAGVDAVRFGPHGPAWPGWVNLLAGWSVPYLLGIAWAGGLFTGRRTPWVLCCGGVASTAALILTAGYPASMVGVPGAAISNLNPPTLAAVTFGLAQVGLALALRERLARWTRRPRVWAATAVVNLSAMTVFCWHQSALLFVVFGTWAGAGRLPGLHDVPLHHSWIPYRLAWLPVFALVLAALWSVFHRFERSR